MSRRVPTLCSVHLRRCRTGQSTRRREGDGVVRGRRLQVAANERAELNLPRVMPSGSAIIIVTHAHLMPNPRSIRLARSVLTNLGGDPGRLAPDRDSGANARRRHCSPGLHDLSLEKEPPGGKESGYHTAASSLFLPTNKTLTSFLPTTPLPTLSHPPHYKVVPYTIDSKDSPTPPGSIHSTRGGSGGRSRRRGSRQRAAVAALAAAASASVDGRWRCGGVPCGTRPPGYRAGR